MKLFVGLLALAAIGIVASGGEDETGTSRPSVSEVCEANVNDMEAAGTVPPSDHDYNVDLCVSMNS